MPSSRRSPSPEVAALRAAAEGSCKQLRDQAREQARLIRSGAVGELTEALRKAWRARHEEAAGRRRRR
ncbi:MAG TPA: hypothetical protein VI365_35265 [Trebonia sp.]